jgi:hypothetical protein
MNTKLARIVLIGLFLPEFAPGWTNGPSGTPWLGIRLAAVAADWLRDRQ